MNWRQKVVLCIGAIIIAIMCFAPPEVRRQGDYSQVQVDVARLAWEVLGVAVLTGTAILVLARKKKSTEKERDDPGAPA